MADFNQHIKQAKSNLTFLSKINKSCNEHWDWQVTTCFYVAVHLANAHFRTHSEVKTALNPTVQISATKFNESEYLSYVKLMNLSRRARYLCHDKPSNKDSAAFFTHDVHLNKALKNLDNLLVFFATEYKVEFEKIDINCQELKNKETTFFVKAI